MATLCCPVNETRSLPRAKSTLEQKAVASECFLPPCRTPLKSGEVKEGREWGGGVFLVVLVVWKVCVAKSPLQPPAFSLLLARFKALGRGGFIGDSWCSCRGARSQPFEEDESDGLGCAVLGQPWSLDGTCLQFSLTVTRTTDL